MNPLPVRTGLADLRRFRRDPLVFLTDVARERGDLAALRLGPYRTLVVSHPEQVGEVLVEQARAVRKSPVLRAARVVLGEGLLTSEGALHRRQRRLVQPAFAPLRLDAYAPVMAHAAGTVAGTWRDGSVLDVHEAMLRVTITAAARTLFGSDLSGRAGVVEAAVEDLLAAYGSPLLPVAHAAQWLPLPAFRRLRRGRTTLDALVGDVIAAGAEGEHLLAALVASGMEPHRLRDEVVTLLLAGHETTASMLAWTWWLLAGHEQARAAVEREADALPPGWDEARPDWDALPVTRGALAEALRLYPPSWAMGRQATADFHVGGLPVRRGTVLIASQWVVHRDARWWPDPDRFDPWRWVDNQGARHPGDVSEPGGRAPAATVERPRHAYFPFGAGPRMCVGEQFAWTEGALAVATVARRWRLLRVPGRDAEPEPRITLRPRDGVWLRAQRR